MSSSTIRVRLNQQIQSIPFYQQKPLSFEELVKHIHILFKGVPLTSYDIIMDGKFTIHDNHTLHQALQGTEKQSRPELILQPKSDHPKTNTVPVIKPTVLRWADNKESNNNNKTLRYSHHGPPPLTFGKRSAHLHQQQKHSNDSTSTTNEDGSSTRKDSGISMDEPVKKKQRVMSADQLTPSSASMMAPKSFSQMSPPTRYGGYPGSHQQRLSSPSPSGYSIHPLEVRRPSTAPSSPSSYSTLSSTHSPLIIKLPALSSITSSSPSLDSDPLLNPQLAPLQRQPTQRKQSQQPSMHEQQHMYPKSITSPHPTSILAPSMSAGSTMTRSASSSLSSSSPPTPCIEQRTIHHHYLHEQQQQRYSPHAHHHQHQHQARPHQYHSHQKQAGQFLCEQVVDPSTGRICGQTFRRSYDLSRHQTIHLKNRPFCYCDQCGKKFTRMDALRRHERVQGHSSKKQQGSQQSLTHPSSNSYHYYSSSSSTSAGASSPSSHAMSFTNPRTTQQARV